ncbi:methyltransferase [Cyclobacterium qasimii]|uniref:O-methyltransferase, family 2 n=2 Tax=Cyclobacterium qasimii TaxID=1350429 RepID=S7V9L2_9BACT|nr:methyltransferase [Cyclobacterium qasimii]EPR66227.1 O-methyltransferase, family 2 [Cyclobacterium qasimii M12-11B]GEO21322.1 methyltransferase/methylase [Cyclobacterium qasimii]
MDITNENQIDPSKIMQIGMGFWASKTLLTAVNMGLFTHLAFGALSGEEIRNKLGLNPRSLFDFLDALVALGFLNRTGIKDSGSYSNSEDSDLFLDKNKPSYIGGILEMSNNRLYPFWNDLEEGLKTGKPQNETKNGGAPVFEAIYANQDRLREFINGMGGAQAGSFIKLAHDFDFSKYNTLCDVGGSGANLSIQIANNNSHMKCITFDLPPVGPIAQENVDSIGLTDRIEVKSGDFFTDELPQADVITMGNILHDWGSIDKLMLIKKAYNSLPEGGAFIVVENIIDDERSKNAFGLLMSLNMAIETDKGFDFTASDFNQWAKEVGFSETKVMPLAGPSSAIVAIK